jgi:hypothetical protein
MRAQLGNGFADLAMVGRGVSLGVLFLAGVLATGCGGGPREPDFGPSEKNLQALGTAISRYGAKMQRPPADLNQLKTWLKQASAKDRESMGIEDLEKIFISPRDKEAYIYVKPATMLSPVYAHEKTGVAGKKQMIGYSLAVEEVSEESLQESLRLAKESS